MNIKVSISLLSIAAAALMAAGCHSGGAYAPKNTTQYDLENHLPFVDLDPVTQSQVTCSGVQVGSLPDGRLQVRANIRNRVNKRVQVQVNCVFKDEQGFSTGDETPFETLTLTENEQETASFTSMNNKAKGYTVRVRLMR